MKRRNFFGTLFGLVVAPSIIVKALSAQPSGFVLKSYPIAGKVRKLKATWSVELEQDLQNYHNIDMSKELSKIIQEEIDREVLATLTRNA